MIIAIHFSLAKKKAQYIILPNECYYRLSDRIKFDQSLKKWKCCLKEVSQPVSLFLKVAQTRICNSQNLATANPISFDVVSARQR